MDKTFVKNFWKLVNVKVTVIYNQWKSPKTHLDLGETGNSAEQLDLKIMVTPQVSGSKYVKKP